MKTFNKVKAAVLILILSCSTLNASAWVSYRIIINWGSYAWCTMPGICSIREVIVVSGYQTITNNNNGTYTFTVPQASLQPGETDFFSGSTFDFAYNYEFTPELIELFQLPQNSFIPAGTYALSQNPAGDYVFTVPVETQE